MRIETPGITGDLPSSPYANCGGMVSFLFSLQEDGYYITIKIYIMDDGGIQNSHSVKDLKLANQLSD